MRMPMMPTTTIVTETSTTGATDRSGASPLFAVPGAIFCGYEVVEVLYVGRRSVVVRCVRLGPGDQAGVPMVVKLLRLAKLGPADVARFRREFELSRRVVHPNVVRAETLESHAGVLFLAMVDDGAVSVRDLLRQGPLPIADALRIAVAVVNALEAIHLRNIIHKDIAPGNIIANLARGTVRLIDFGISADVSVERPPAASLPELEGTLAYMAPEQTGRMNRDLDYRADFYALGATLHELLTGTPPFGTTRDPIEAVHAHLALVPPDPRAARPEVPPVLAALLLRLLAKEPEARFQNHHVLRRDLQYILEHLDDPAALARHRLGRGDLAERFQVSGRLYGRADEVRRMVAAFEAAAAGVARIVTIAGVSGIGKTALVNEVHRSLLAHRGHLVHGKFDQFGQHTPARPFCRRWSSGSDACWRCPLPNRPAGRRRCENASGPTPPLRSLRFPRWICCSAWRRPRRCRSGPRRPRTASCAPSSCALPRWPARTPPWWSSSTTCNGPTASPGGCCANSRSTRACATSC